MTEGQYIKYDKIILKPFSFDSGWQMDLNKFSEIIENPVIDSPLMWASNSTNGKSIEINYNGCYYIIILTDSTGKIIAEHNDINIVFNDVQKILCSSNRELCKIRLPTWWKIEFNGLFISSHQISAINTKTELLFWAFCFHKKYHFSIRIVKEQTKIVIQFLKDEKVQNIHSCESMHKTIEIINDFMLFPHEYWKIKG